MEPGACERYFGQNAASAASSSARKYQPLSRNKRPTIPSAEVHGLQPHLDLAAVEDVPFDEGSLDHVGPLSVQPALAGHRPEPDTLAAHVELRVAAAHGAVGDQDVAAAVPADRDDCSKGLEPPIGAGA